MHVKIFKIRISWPATVTGSTTGGLLMRLASLFVSLAKSLITPDTSLNHYFQPDINCCLTMKKKMAEKKITSWEMLYYL